MLIRLKLIQNTYGKIGKRFWYLFWVDNVFIDPTTARLDGTPKAILKEIKNQSILM